MFTFADLMRQAQGGQALDNIAKAYGLERGEVDKLMAALLPVFALGMRKSVQEMAFPAAAADLLDPTKFRKAYDDVSEAVSPAATEAARLTLEKFFGRGDAAKVVADQVAAFSGLGADVVSRVMPAMAATLFGGLSRELESSPFAPFMAAWSQGAKANPFMGAGMGAGMGGANPFAAAGNPMKDAMSAFLKGYAEGKPDPAGAGAGDGIQWPPGMEGFGKFFEAGVDMTEAQRKAIEQLFEGPPKKRNR